MGNQDTWHSVLTFFSELGDHLAKYATQGGYAIAMVVVGWVIWPIGALIASLLIASLYHRAAQPVGSTSISTPVSQHGEQHWLILAGLLLILMGIFWLLRELIPHISFAFVIIALGLFLIFFGLARREGGSHA